LEQFDVRSVQIFQTSEGDSAASAFQNGLAQIQGQPGFDPQTNCFSYEGLDLEWTKEVNEGWQERTQKKRVLEELKRSMRIPLGVGSVDENVAQMSVGDIQTNYYWSEVRH